MAAANEEGPDGQVEAFENTTHPTEEKTMNDSMMTRAGDQEPGPVTLDELRALAHARRQAFHEEHREAIEGARPWWAQQAVVDAVEGDEADLIYRTSYGAVEFACTAELVAGSVSFPRGNSPDIAILAKTEGLTAAEMRALASDLLTAVPYADAVEDSR